MIYQSTVDMDFQLYRAYEKRIEKYFLGTSYEELIKKDEMSQLWSALSFFHKKTLISLRVEV